jgi:hypothetical protein
MMGRNLTNRRAAVAKSELDDAPHHPSFQRRVDTVCLRASGLPARWLTIAVARKVNLLAVGSQFA